VGVTEQLARFAIETDGRSLLTPEVVASAKAKFLDTLGIMLAGSRAPPGRIAAKVARESGGHPESTVVGYGDKTSMALAGFANAASAHSLEYDDNTFGIGHLSVCLVPGCLAVAERLDLSGRQMLEAFAVGFEVCSRLGKGLKPYLLDRGWHSMAIVGGQGVTVATCRMMQLDQRTTRMAMGIVASSATGLRKNVGSMGKAFHAGNGVRAGIFGATLASAGFEVDPDIIEGSEEAGTGHARFGLADAFNGIGNYHLDKMVDNLGASFELGRNTTLVRMHPGSTYPGPLIDGLIEVATKHDVNGADVEELVLECTPRMIAIASYAEPTDVFKAKLSLAYIAAITFLDRKLGLGQYTEEKLKDPNVRDFMRRIKLVVPDDLKQKTGPMGEGGVNWGESRITVRLRDGRELKQSCFHAKGWPANPATWDDLSGKYADCTEGILAPTQRRESIEMLGKLQDLGSVHDLMSALRPMA